MMMAQDFARGFDFIEQLNFEDENEPQNQPQAHQEVRLKGWAIWKCMEDLLFRTFFHEDYAFQFSPTL